MKKSTLLLIATLFILPYLSKAQDLIYKKDNTILKTVLIEIGSDDISYKDYSNQAGSVLKIKKGDVSKIKTEKGKEIFFEQNNTTSFDKKNIIKTGVFAWALSQISLSYERSLTPARSLEVNFGAIGIGLKPADVTDLVGLYTRFGYKFIRSPEHYTSKGHEAHLLKGAYIRPEITFGYFSETKTYYYPIVQSWWGEDVTTNVTFYSLMLNLGKQWVISDDFSIDVFGGAGFGGNSGGKRNYNYAITGSSPIFFDGGVRVGVLF